MCRRLWAPGQTPEEHHRQAQRGQTRYCLWKRTVYGLEDRTPACSKQIQTDQHSFPGTIAKWHGQLCRRQLKGLTALGRQPSFSFHPQLSECRFAHAVKRFLCCVHFGMLTASSQGDRFNFVEDETNADRRSNDKFDALLSSSWRSDRMFNLIFS